MDDKMIIDSFVQGIKAGKFTIEQVLEEWKEQVKEAIK